MRQLEPPLAHPSTRPSVVLHPPDEQVSSAKILNAFLKRGLLVVFGIMSILGVPHLDCGPGVGLQLLDTSSVDSDFYEG